MDEFRPMRRKGQALSRQECEKILRLQETGVLALWGDGDYPYAVPLNFVYFEDSLYFHGALKGHRAEACKRGGKASFCVISKDRVDPEEYATLFESVIVFGKIRVVTGEERLRALTAFARKYVPMHTEERRQAQIRLEEPETLVTALSVEHMTGKESRKLAALRKKGETGGETED